ncbi:SurA N-terminal domain-containing protein [Leptospira interrogans]
MLEILRRSVTGWVAKILMGLLILSFAVWGIADVFTGANQAALVKVGDREITSDEFQRALQIEMEYIARQIGRRPTMEQARAWGLDARVMARLIGSSAVEQRAGQMGLALSDTGVAEAIRNDPAFRGPDGNFSRVAVDYAARELGVTELGFINMRRREEIREQLTGALASGVVVPDTMLDILRTYRDESRTAEHFTIDPAVAITLPEPDETKLKETYEANKQRLMTPEFRNLAIINLTAESVGKQIAISDADIAAAYEHDKARFAVPERRRILQIAFADKAAADKAAAAIAGGRSFEDVAKEFGVEEKDYSLGLMTRADLIDPKIAEVAFGLASGGVSDVVEGRFATVIVKVTDIEPGKQRTLDEVKEELRNQLAADKAGPEINRLHDEIDDNRAAGKPLKEIASSLNVPFIEIAAVDRTGKTPDGKPALDSPDAQRLLAVGFQTAVGSEGETIELAGGGYGWVDVLNITETKQRSFEEAEADVKALWREQETRRLLAELAAKLAERATQGEAMDKLAAEVGGKVETAANFKRIGGAPGLPEAAITLAFITPKGNATSVETQDGKSRLVFRVTEITPAPATSKEELDKLRPVINRQMQGDALASYVAALQQQLGVNINQDAYLRAIGAERQQ